MKGLRFYIDIFILLACKILPLFVVFILVFENKTEPNIEIKLKNNCFFKYFHLFQWTRIMPQNHKNFTEVGTKKVTFSTEGQKSRSIFSILYSCRWCEKFAPDSLLRFAWLVRHRLRLLTLNLYDLSVRDDCTVPKRDFFS